MAQIHRKPSVAFIVIRILLILVLIILLVVSSIHFIISLNALGDDIDVARETHLTHDHQGNHIFGVTDSSRKEDHISSLIIWVVVTMMAAIFAAAGIIGAIWVNPCLVVMCAIMTFIFAVSGIFLPDVGLTLPHVSSNYYLTIVEVIAIILSILFAITFRYSGVRKPKKEVTFEAAS